ncbi:hypothetical protein EDB19DRAFT_1334886 [Suillus lakei]|nr:hypothetical protein EDB19DRAFT_1334886 [Suillus lakei]
MNSFKKMFQKNDDQMVSLKHSKSMPYGPSSQKMREPPRTDASKPVYRGKTPLNKSNIVYVEQAPGMLDIDHSTLPQNLYYDVPTRANLSTRADLLAKFPHSPELTVGLPRSGFRAVSLNSKSIRPQVPVQNSSTSGQQAYPSIPRRKQRREATADQYFMDMLKTADGHTPILGSSRQAERVRAKSSVGRSYTPAAPPPPIPTIHSPRPIISRSAHGSRVDIRDVPSHVVTPFTPAPGHGQPHRSHGNYDAISKERDPKVIRRMINRYPIAPLCSERCPEHLRPLRFNMEDPRHFEQTLGFYINMALAQGRPLDARADGLYRRILDAGAPTGIVPETGIDWSRQVSPTCVCCICI